MLVVGVAFAPVPTAAQDTQSTPTIATATLNITRLTCEGDPAASEITVMAAATPAASPSLPASADCQVSSGDVLLLYDFGTVVRTIAIPDTGTVTVSDVSVSSSGGSKFRLVDSASSVSTAIVLDPNALTSIIIRENIAPEPTMVPFPTMAPFPTFPPMPTMRPFPTEPAFPTMPAEVDQDSGTGTASTIKTGRSDMFRQFGFLILVALAFVGIRIWKRKANRTTSKRKHKHR